MFSCYGCASLRLGLQKHVGRLLHEWQCLTCLFRFTHSPCSPYPLCACTLLSLRLVAGLAWKGGCFKIDPMHSNGATSIVAALWRPCV
eukprot:scaffold180138_cov26-Tisochrysis_lutea.AAC.1